MDLTKREKHTLLARTRALVVSLKDHRGEIQGPLLTPHGHEAVGLGVALGFREKGILEESMLYGDYRTLHGIAVAKDAVLSEAHNHAELILANHFLREDSPNRGRDGNIHFGCFEHRIGPVAVSHVGAMAPTAVGHALALQMDNSLGIGAVFFGEGAAQQGGVHEAMNMAVAKNISILLVVNKNGWAISTNSQEEHGNSKLSDRAKGYGKMLGMDADGDDLDDVIEKTIECIEFIQEHSTPALLVCHTKRRTGHNDDEDVTVYYSQEEIDEDWKTEPLLRYRLFLSDVEDLPIKELEETERAEQIIMEKLAQEILAKPPITLKWHNEQDQSLFSPHEQGLEPVPDGSGTKMRYGLALKTTLQRILEQDSDAVFFGEDVAKKGGVMEVTRGLVEQFDSERVFNTPISEEAITGLGVGLALGGKHPISEIQFSPFFAEALAQYAYVIGPNWYQKQMRMGFVQIHHFGVVRGGGSGEYHSDCTEKYLYSVQGIKIVFPADAYDMAGLLNAAHQDPNPVILYSQIYGYAINEFSAKVPDDLFTIPIGKAAVKREGTDVTVVTYGAACVRAALNEAEYLAEEGISCEVIDLRTIVPMDMETVGESIRKTSRVLIMHEARKTGSVGESIIAKITQDETIFPYLRTLSIPLLAADDTPISTVRELEWARLPFDQFELKSGEIILRSAKLNQTVHTLVQY